MTRDEVIEHVCQTVGIAYNSIGDYEHASDGFCNKCPFHNEPDNFQHEGKSLEYVRNAVVEKLKADGHVIKGL